MDRDYVLRWAHLGLARNPRYRHVIQAQRRIAEEHIKEIWAEQEAKNAELHRIDCSHIPPLRIADRYAAGRPCAASRKRPSAKIRAAR